MLKLHYSDLSDTSNLTRIIRDIEPDEVYKLGTQSLAENCSEHTVG